MSKAFTYLFYFCILVVNAYGQLRMDTTILNEPPVITQIQTYNRYDSPTDNFATDTFFVCVGEENRTVHLRITAQDSNSHLEISNGGNVSFKVVSVVNNSELDIASFGSEFKGAVFESTIGTTQITSISNLTLSNTSSYRIIANVSDGTAAGQGTFNFTVNNTNCARVEENVDLVTNQTYLIENNFTEVAIIVDENISGQIVITEYNQSPVDSNALDALDKYLTVDVTGPIQNVTVNLTIEVTYADADLNGKQLDETTLQLYNWNGSDWIVTTSTINIVGNVVTFVIEGTKNGIADVRLGTFSIRGSQSTPPASSSSSGGGSGGGGGGGGSGGGGGGAIIDFFRGEDQASQEPQQPAAAGADTQSAGGNAGTDAAGDEDGQTIGVPLESAPGNITEEKVDSSFSGITSYFSAVNSLFVTDTHESFCLIIIIILLLLWLGTLILWLRERRKRREERDLLAQINKEDAQDLITQNWLITLILWLRERRKRFRNKDLIDQLKSERRKDLLAQKEAVTKKINEIKRRTRG